MSRQWFNFPASPTKAKRGAFNPMSPLVQCMVEEKRNHTDPPPHIPHTPWWDIIVALRQAEIDDSPGRAFDDVEAEAINKANISRRVIESRFNGVRGALLAAGYRDGSQPPRHEYETYIALMKAQCDRRGRPLSAREIRADLPYSVRSCQERFQTVETLAEASGWGGETGKRATREAILGKLRDLHTRSAAELYQQTPITHLDVEHRFGDFETAVEALREQDEAGE